MDNKHQLIHYASEILVLTGLVIYFSKKNKTMMNHIEEISQRLEEQEETLQKHEKLIISLSEKVKSLTINALQKQENLRNASTSTINNSQQTEKKVKYQKQQSPTFQQSKDDSQEVNNIIFKEQHNLDSESLPTVNNLHCPEQNVNYNTASHSFQCAVADDETHINQQNIFTHKKPDKIANLMDMNAKSNNLQFHILDFAIGGNLHRKNKPNQSNSGKIVELEDEDDNTNKIFTNETKTTILNNVRDTKKYNEDTDDEIQDELNELENENILSYNIG